jgi:hypothetical protein
MPVLRPLPNRTLDAHGECVSREPADAWIAAHAQARRRPLASGALPSWPNQAPPLARPMPARLDVRGWRHTPLSLGILAVTAAVVAGLASQPWLRDFVTVVVACIVAGLGVGVAVMIGRTRFVADRGGIWFRQPLGAAVLPWSALEAIRCPPPQPMRVAGLAGWHRTRVVIELVDGTRVAPFALVQIVNLRTVAGIERAVAEWHDLTALWRTYGPPSASQMWGRPAGAPPLPGSADQTGTAAG